MNNADTGADDPDIHRRAATHPVQDGRAAQGPEQGGGLRPADRRDRQLDIAPGLHQDTAQASHPTWPFMWS